ncbi:DEAD/DEAH box helicase [Paenibacillus glacialis]|nr:helicase-related protein [Paenibacillus glacialis]
MSLDMRVDLMWWAGVARDPTCTIVFIARELPLGWALKMGQVKVQGRGIDSWNIDQWKRYAIESLREELEEEGKFQSNSSFLSEKSMWIWRVQDGCNTAGDLSVHSQRNMERGQKGMELRNSMGAGELKGDSIMRRGHIQENEQRLSEERVQALWDSSMKDAGRGRKAGDLRLHGVMQAVLVDANELAKVLEGRSLLAAEVDGLLAEAAPSMASDWLTATQLAYLQGQLMLGAGVAPAASPCRGAPWQRRRKLPRCRRCGSVALGRTACATCGSAACTYCEACLAMGRSRACTLLLRGAAQPAVRGTAGGSPTEAVGRWGLSAAQSAAAGAALQFLAKPTSRVGIGREELKCNVSVPSTPDRFLLWAVTGAGKTEMIFPLLASILEAGGRVLVATPRRDVVLELAPRLARAFPDERIVTLYGGSEERWRSGTMTLATTHQLMRFYEAFDLVIIDEIDAFPFHNDPMLAYAAQNACKYDGKFVYLSATPPRQLQKEASRGILPHAKVPVRFHGHPLPVPSRLDMKSVAHCLHQRRIPVKLLRNLEQSIKRGAQLFVFVSRIRHIEPFVMLLRRYMPRIRIEGTSSVDPQRSEKVAAFRDTQIRLLITTTILERGVTVARSDVFILDADSGLFDEASLIQMSGRAGRSKDDPAGRVFLTSSHWTSSQKGAISQIKRMNRIAQKGGYLTRDPMNKQASPEH